MWDCLAAKTFYVGPGATQPKMKLVTNLVLGLNRAVLAEGLVFAQSEDFEGKGRRAAKQSRLFAHHGRERTENGEGRFTPQARLAQHIKDVRLILQRRAGG